MKKINQIKPHGAEKRQWGREGNQSQTSDDVTAKTKKQNKKNLLL